jgi:hypothetical protein
MLSLLFEERIDDENDIRRRAGIPACAIAISTKAEKY